MRSCGASARELKVGVGAAVTDASEVEDDEVIDIAN